MLTPKFIRAHNIPSTAGSKAFEWFFKLMYEFWGFCVNGGDDLKVPGGFAPLTGVSMPAGFESGSQVLIASGTDGFTQNGMPFFNSLDKFKFSGSYVGKHLVTWKSGSTSTDDSIYEIIGWVNSGTIRVNILEGGTPYTGSLHPGFTDRTQINYRIIDFLAAANLSGYTTSSDYLVLQFNGAPLVNPGQPLSQAKITKRLTGIQAPNVPIQLSPSGSWHGYMLDSGSWSSGSYSSGSYSTGSWSSGSYTSGSWSSGSWTSGSWTSGSYTSGSWTSGSWTSGSYASGSWTSGSYVHYTGSFQFFPTSNVTFAGLYTEITGGAPNLAAGAILTGEMLGFYTPAAAGVLSGNFYLGDDITPVVTGTAWFTGSINGGLSSFFEVTGTFVPVNILDEEQFLGTYIFDPQGTFTPSGNFTPSGDFVPTGTFNPEGDFIPTGTFVPTGTFEPTGTFTPSGDFIPTGTFNPGGIFTPEGTFIPTGSFTPSGNLLAPGFFDGTAEIIANTNSFGWSTIGPPVYITLIAATDFIICHYKANNWVGSGFHIEIPQRLYPQHLDPAPIMAMNYGGYTPTQTDDDQHYAGGFYMHNPPDGTTMRYNGYVRQFFGDDETYSIGQGVNGRQNGAYFNTYQNKFLFVDAILGRPDIPGQYQLARVRFRRARFIAPIIPQFERATVLS